MASGCKTEMKPPAMDSFAGRRVVVMGLGRFGGGIGVSRWLIEQGARVTITDLGSRESLAGSLEQMAGLSFELAAGEHPASLLAGCDLLVVSPAVDKRTSPFFLEAVQRGVPWSSEMDLFLERCPARVVGVTGSAGKSTTVSMIDSMLAASCALGERAGQVHVGGNIGRSLLSQLSGISSRDTVVLELSSFQLEDIAAIERGPDVAVVTNIAPNHLDRHGTMEAYIDAKRNIVRYLPDDGVFVRPANDNTLAGWAAAIPQRSLTFSLDDATADVYALESDDRVVLRSENGELTTLLQPSSLRVPGRHNILNAICAAAASTVVGASPGALATGAAAFGGLPHRLEFVRDYNDVRYYNDSKSTTPDATMVALRAFDAPTVVLVGGYDKKLPFDAMADALMARSRAVVCFGAARAQIRSALEKHRREDRAVSVKTVHDFDGGVNLARRLAKPGDVVLFSPACASYDAFVNFEARGERFRSIVKSWI